MAKKIQKTILGISGKLADEFPCQYTQCDEHGKKNDCNLACIIVYIELTFRASLSAIHNSKMSVYFFKCIFSIK